MNAIAPFDLRHAAFAKRSPVHDFVTKNRLALRNAGYVEKDTLDSFKSMMKKPRWPLMMILSGVPSLAEYIQAYEQPDALLDPVHFSIIKLRREEDFLTWMRLDH